MLQIACPYCGTREETEFTFGGPAHVARPDLHSSDLQWTDYLFGKDNPKGIHHERWLHTFGCARWFHVARDTVTHEIHAVYRMNEPKPIVEGGDCE